MRSLLYTSLLLLCSATAFGQLTIGGGIEAGYPFRVDKQGFYNRFSYGAGIDISYRPVESRLYPSVSLFVTNMQVTVESALFFNDLNTTAFNRSLSVALNYRLTDDEEKYFTFQGGIGIMQIVPRLGEIKSNAGASFGQLVYKGGNQLYPAVHVGLSYFKQLSYASPLFLCVEGRIAYAYLYEKKNYYIEVPAQRFDAAITGHLLNPAFRVTLNYFFLRD